ncbi:MAG: hypothetical protein EZS28_009762 [Streblomastix strix]|uniref:Uncharacterized protein n=1 Tax=Streblomastix strix TaxID=222440 RepID=A0A5J4WIP8_9EUKA|nr:MAG: hypothetical protein EZS28_009762 [Streblomastix strix]
MFRPTIPEVDPKFGNEIEVDAVTSQINPFQQQVIRCEMPTLSARRRSSIFEETLIPDHSVSRQLLDIISEDEHMIKESAHFVLSDNLLIQVVIYTFYVPESQIQLSIEDEGCCDLHMLDVVLNHDQKLYDSSRYNTIAPEPYNSEEIDEILDEKLNIYEQIDAYSKTEDDALLLLKADKTELIDAYNKTEVDALFDDKLNISDQIDAYIKQYDDELIVLTFNISDQIDTYMKSEDNALLLKKANKTELIDEYSKPEADALLDDKLNISDQTDAYSKTEDDVLLQLKANITELDSYIDLTSTQTITVQKQLEMINISRSSKQNNNDAFNLLDDDGDMLVSSLLSLSQLQEVRDFASGESKKYVFINVDMINTRMKDQENVEKLATGDNLQFVNKEVTEYLWNGTNL